MRQKHQVGIGIGIGVGVGATDGRPGDKLCLTSQYSWQGGWGWCGATAVAGVWLLTALTSAAVPNSNPTPSPKTWPLARTTLV